MGTRLPRGKLTVTSTVIHDMREGEESPDGESLRCAESRSSADEISQGNWAIGERDWGNHVAVSKVEGDLVARRRRIPIRGQHFRLDVEKPDFGNTRPSVDRDFHVAIVR